VALVVVLLAAAVAGAMVAWARERALLVTGAAIAALAAAVVADATGRLRTAGEG
jgi:hypothetical protein